MRHRFGEREDHRVTAPELCDPSATGLVRVRSQTHRARTPDPHEPRRQKRSFCSAHERENVSTRAGNNLEAMPNGRRRSWWGWGWEDEALPPDTVRKLGQAIGR